MSFIEQPKHKSIITNCVLLTRIYIMLSGVSILLPV